MDTRKALETQLIEETLFVWMAVHGNLCLALRHPSNKGPSREYVRQFVEKLGAIFVDRGLFTPAELRQATAVERQEEIRQRNRGEDS